MSLSIIHNYLIKYSLFYNFLLHSPSPSLPLRPILYNIKARNQRLWQALNSSTSTEKKWKPQPPTIVKLWSARNCLALSLRPMLWSLSSRRSLSPLARRMKLPFLICTFLFPLSLSHSLYSYGFPFFFIAIWLNLGIFYFAVKLNFTHFSSLVLLSFSSTKSTRDETEKKRIK